MNAPIDKLPEVIKAGELANQTYEIALEIKVDSAEMMAIAGDELRGIVTKRKRIEEMRLAITRPMDEAKAKIMDLFRAPTDRLGQAESLLRDEITQYQRIEREKADQLRREAEAKAAAERAELERQRQAALEAERQAQIAQQQADDAARAKADEARRAGDEAAAAAAEAVAHQQREAAQRAAEEAAQRAEEMQQQIELAEIAPPQAVVSIAPKAAGISTTKRWKAEVTDLSALVMAAADKLRAGDTSLLAFLAADTTAINGAARSMRDNLMVPGIRVYAEDGLSVRRAG
jgi:membrane protein involved in colicin uptake